MSSGIYTTIKLHPFYQEFLTGQFLSEGPVFRFPKGHDLLMRLEVFLTKRPYEPRPSNFGTHTFRIEIPFMEHKDPFYYHYISEKKNVLFTRRIREYFRDIIHDQIGRQRRKGFMRTEILYSLMEDFNISPVHFDLMEKEYKRYIDTERLRRFRKNQKKPRKTAKLNG